MLTPRLEPCVSGLTTSLVVNSLTPGSYNIRVVVRDNLTGKIGSALLPLDVK